MIGEKSTVSYLRALARARAKTAAEEWDGASRSWEMVVSANPVNGTFWAQLGAARYRMKDYRGAMMAFEQALELGTFAEDTCFPFDLAYRIACCYALLEEGEPALEWLAKAFDLGYRDLEQAQTDDDLASLRDDPRYRDIVALADTGELSRDEGWRHDLILLAREVKRKAYDPFRLVSEADFDAAVQKLHGSVPKLSDMQVIVEMRKLLRVLGDGHARITGTDQHHELQQRLPLQFYLFEEGLYIIAAAPEHKGLLGVRVLRFGEQTVDQVMAALDVVICRDNEWWPREMAPHRMRELPLLHALGLTPESDQVELTVLDADGKTRPVHIAVDPSSPRPGTALPDPGRWLTYAETLSSPLPLYLKNRDAAYWFEYLPADLLIYFQFNSVRDEPEESLADFCERLFAFVEDSDVEKLVLDMRWNGGGNTFLELALLHRLIGCKKVNRRGKLFVIIGRATFSAAQNGATLIERHTEAIFVGEPSGSSPNFIGETIPITLPYSKLQLNVSDLYWQTSWPMDHRTWIAPLLYTPPTFAAYRENRDPALEAILAAREHFAGC